MLRNKHVTRFGDPTTRTGARYGVSDQRGLALMAIDLELARRHMEGIQITPNDIVHLAAEIGREQAAHNAIISAAGIPPGFKSLFESTSKSELAKTAKNLTITEFQLFLLINNSSQIGFRHRSKFPEFIPEHLVITDQDWSKMKQGEVRPVSKKLTPLLLERRHIHVHLFERGTEWHCFYFSYEDIEPEPMNHWLHGPHLHYVSHLWPNHNKDRIWTSFNKRKTDIRGKLHIRFVTFDFSDKPWRPPKARRTQGHSAGSFLFSPELAIPRGPEPTPTAQLATRGAWFVNVSVPAPKGSLQS